MDLMVVYDYIAPRLGFTAQYSGRIAALGCKMFSR